MSTVRERGLGREYPFLGVGISASAAEAASIARALVAGEAGHLPAVDFLNVGVSTAAPVPEGLGDLLREASLESVAHLEEVNLAGGLDEARLRGALERCEAFGPRWLQEDLGVWVWRGGPLGERMIPPILDEAGLAQAAENVGRVMEASRFPFLAENPPFYYVVGDIDLLTFMAELSGRTGCGLLLDVGHFIGYCACTGRDPLGYLSGWSGWGRLVEVHLAGYTTSPTDRGLLWQDEHEAPLRPLALDVLDRILSFARGVKAVTVEVEGARLDVVRDNVRRVAERLRPVEAP